VAKFSALKARLRLSVDKNGDVHYCKLYNTRSGCNFGYYIWDMFLKPHFMYDINDR
jgi:hypothetical protein